MLAGGGKRFRPVLLLLSAESLGISFKEALPVALSLELFHNFTLVHDDIMDHADTRRGRATVHLKWNENTAILSGDYMMGLAYRQLADLPPDLLGPILKRYHTMLENLCEGQMRDMAFEEEEHVSIEAYLEMIDGKTGALVQACLEMAGVLARCSLEELHQLHLAGKALGRAFQIQDDLLDLTAKDARWGKRIGGDLIEGKKAWLLLQTLEVAQGGDRAWFDKIVSNNGLEPDRIDEARNRMERLGVLDSTRAKVFAYSDEATTLLQSVLPDNLARSCVLLFIEQLKARLH